MGSNPGEGMNVYKCIVVLRQGVTLNSHRTASPLMRLVEEEERWETPDHLQDILPQNRGGTEPNRVVSCIWCSNLRITTSVHVALCRDEFCEPRYDAVRQVELTTTQQNKN
ncbi:uncharacterized protein TNCV_1224021 [Trichonephila clavipes]|nr:uncharacterized protein TNCV_1224021 [Trichonephila clavipes]